MPMCKAQHAKKSQLDKERRIVPSHQGSDGLIPIDRIDILIALAGFEDRLVNEDQEPKEWI